MTALSRPIIALVPLTLRSIFALATESPRHDLPSLSSSREAARLARDQARTSGAHQVAGLCLLIVGGSLLSGGIASVLRATDTMFGTGTPPAAGFYGGGAAAIAGFLCIVVGAHRFVTGTMEALELRRWP